MKKKLIHIITLCFLGTLFISCSKEIDTKEFYFKPDMFKTTKTYKFKCKEDNTKTESWKISNTAPNTIYTTRKNYENRLIDELKEKITENGSELISYFKPHFDKKVWIKNIDFYPKKTELIKWNLNKKSVYEGEFIVDGIILNLKREREFIEITELNLISRKIETLVFKDILYLKSIGDSKTNLWNSEYGNKLIQYSYFGKGLGLIKFKRKFESGKTETMELIEIN